MGCANGTPKVGIPLPATKQVEDYPAQTFQVLTSLVIMMSKSKPEPIRCSSIRASQEQLMSPTPKDSNSMNQELCHSQGPERLTKTTSLTPLKITSGFSAFKANMNARLPSSQEFVNDEKQPKTPLRDDVRITEKRKPSYDSPALINTRFGGGKSILFREPLTPNNLPTRAALKKSRSSRRSQLDNLPLGECASSSGVRITTLPRRRMTAVGGISPQNLLLIGSQSKQQQQEIVKIGGITSKGTDLPVSQFSSKILSDQNQAGILKRSSSARRRLNSEVLDRNFQPGLQKLNLTPNRIPPILDDPPMSVRPFHARKLSNQLSSQIGNKKADHSGTISNFDTNQVSPSSPTEIPPKSVQVLQSKKIMVKPGTNRFEELILEDSSRSEDDSVSIAKDLVEYSAKANEKQDPKMLDQINEDSYQSVKVEGFQENKGNPFTKPKVNREIKITRLRQPNSKKLANDV
jgi:hypothetical protein